MPHASSRLGRTGEAAGPFSGETLPRGTWAITVPPEFVAVLGSGEHPLEVLAIEAGGKQTITEGTFEIP